MAIVVETLEQAAQVKMVRLGKKLWLTADKSRVVKEGHPDAAFLYCTADDLVSKEEAERLGALPKKRPVQPAEEKTTAEPEEAQGKQRRQPRQDKMREREEDK